MDKKQTIVRELLIKHLDATETPEEAEQLSDLMFDFNTSDLTEILLTIIPDEKYVDDSYKQYDWEGARDKILRDHPAKKTKGRWIALIYVKYAAVFIAAIAIGALVWVNTKKSYDTNTCGLVQPSGDEAKKLIKWVNNNGMMTLSISPGWQFRTELPDGTQVVLNTGSSVTFPMEKPRAGDIRKLTVEGEVFLDVAEDTLHPLYVTARGMRFEASGTAFNMNAYPDSDSVYATVMRGELLAINGDNNHKILHPGQQLIAAAGTERERPLYIGNGDLAQLAQWQQGYFSFLGSPVKNVMQELARWYEWKVEFHNYEQHAKVNRTFCRRSTEKEALAELKQAGVSFEQIGNRIIIH